MTDNTSPDPSSEIIESAAMCTLEELCVACNVEAGWIAELVEHGVIEPAGTAGSDWQFASLSIVRVAKAKRLERDLSLNPPGVALVLDLLDEIDTLRSRLRAVEAPAEPDSQS
jgi:chaperone modulatory protein CbpM